MGKKGNPLIDYFVILFKHWKFILISFVGVCIVAAGISLVLPKWYLAQTTILPPVPEESSMALSTLLENLPLAGLGLLPVSEETELFLAILESRTVMESVAERFNLLKRYKKKNMEETIKSLRDHVSADIDDEGTVTLMAEAGTPFLSSKETDDEARKLAKDMANFFIAELDRVNRCLKTEKARNFRIFIEKRYHQNLDDLRRAEEGLKAFQEKYGIIALPEQTEATVVAAAELQAQIMAKEIESRVLKNYVGRSHTDYLRVQNELNELRRKFEEFKKSGESGITEEGVESKSLFLPFEKAPDLGVKYLRLFRELTLQEKILEFLLPQYEEAKIKEARDTPTVQVLDRAVRPERKHKPKRAIIVVFYGFLSLVLSSMFVFFRPAVEELYRSLKEQK